VKQISSVCLSPSKKTLTDKKNQKKGEEETAWRREPRGMGAGGYLEDHLGTSLFPPFKLSLAEGKELSYEKRLQTTERRKPGERKKDPAAAKIGTRG